MAEHPEGQRNDRNEDGKLDRTLDALLSAYSSAEPRPGLETRILAQVREASGRRKAWSVRWMWIGAAFAAAVIVLAIYLSRPALRPQVPEIVRQPAPAEKIQPSPAPRISSPPTTETVGQKRDPQQDKARNRRIGQSQLADLRQEVFPAPVPLSQQEKLLLRYLSGTPREEVIAQSRPDEPPDDTDAGPDQSALPGSSSTNQKLTNTR